MNVFKQVIVPIVALVGLIGGLTFLLQSGVATVDTGGKVEQPPVPPLVNYLSFPDGQKVTWTPEWAGEFEANVPGYHDFVFDSRMDTPLEVGVAAKNCKCQKIELCVLTPEEMEKYQKVKGNDEQAEKALPPQERWQVLELDDSRTKGVTVKPRASGIVRMRWEPKKAGPEMLTAEIWSHPEAAPKEPYALQRLELPVTFVSPVRALPNEAAVGDLPLSGMATTNFAVWSSSRPSFGLKAFIAGPDGSPDPCFTCTVKPLTKEELEALQEKAQARVRCGYRIDVQIRERVDDKVQLDLGPFRRKLSLETDPVLESSNPPVVSGTVRGEVIVGNEDNRDRIVLGAFRAEAGKKVTVPLTTEQMSLELALDHVEPDYVKVELDKPSPNGSGKQWHLQVDVPPDAGLGVFPPNSAVYLKVLSPTPRRIRIPVSGNAYQR